MTHFSDLGVQFGYEIPISIYSNIKFSSFGIPKLNMTIKNSKIQKFKKKKKTLKLDCISKFWISKYPQWLTSCWDKCDSINEKTSYEFDFMHIFLTPKPIILSQPYKSNSCFPNQHPPKTLEGRKCDNCYDGTNPNSKDKPQTHFESFLVPWGIIIQFQKRVARRLRYFS